MTEGSVVLESQNSYYLSKAFTTNHDVSLSAVGFFFFSQNGFSIGFLYVTNLYNAL